MEYKQSLKHHTVTYTKSQGSMLQVSRFIVQMTTLANLNKLTQTYITYLFPALSLSNDRKGRLRFLDYKHKQSSAVSFLINVHLPYVTTMTSI